MTYEPEIVRRKERGVGVRDGTGQDGLRSYWVPTAMIWMMERRTIVAAMVGGNCNMGETLEAISPEVTIQ